VKTRAKQGGAAFLPCAGGRALAAADCDDNFQPVAVGQHLLLEAAAWHDLAIALQRNALACELHILDQGGDADRLLELARRAVY
jgi:hypothetical protein